MIFKKIFTNTSSILFQICLLGFVVSDNSTIGDSIIEDVSEVSETNLDVDSGDQVTRLQLFSTPLQFPISLPYRSNLNKFKYQFRRLLLFNVFSAFIYFIRSSCLWICKRIKGEGVARATGKINTFIHASQPEIGRRNRYTYAEHRQLFLSLFFSPLTLFANILYSFYISSSLSLSFFLFSLLSLLPPPLVDETRCTSV